MTAGETFRAAYEADFEPSTPGDAVVLDRICALLDQTEQMEAQVTTDGYIVLGGNKQDRDHEMDV